MKKRIMGLVAIAFVMVFVSGCGSSGKLECSISAGGENMKLISTFDGNTLKSIAFTGEMDLSSYTDTEKSYIEKQDLCKTFASSMGYKFSSCDQNISGDTLSVKAEVDMNSVSESDKTGSVEATKKQLESAGYTCSIK